MIFRLFIRLIAKLRRKAPVERRERPYESGYHIPDTVWYKKPTAKYNDVW